jgi:hypothetical protein
MYQYVRNWLLEFGIDCEKARGPIFPSGLTSKSADVGGLLYAASPADDKVDVNSTDETAFSSTYTIPAAALAVGDALCVRAHFTVDGAVSTPNVTLRFKLGGQTVASQTIPSVATNDSFSVVVNVLVNAAATSRASLHLAGIIGGSGTGGGSLTNGTGLSWAAAQALTVTAEWSAANAGNDISLETIAVYRNA